MKSTRYCQVSGHQDNNSSYICTYEGCLQNYKWACVDCIFLKIHHHGLPDQNHLMKQSQLLELIQKQSQFIYDKFKEDKKLIQIFIRGLQDFLKSSKLLINQLQNDLLTLEQNYNFKEINSLIKITKNDYFLLENQQIEKIINLNNRKNINTCSLQYEFLQYLIKQFQDLQKVIENNHKYILNVNVNNQTFDNFSLIQYNNYFEDQSDIDIVTSSISFDEKYLIIGRENGQIQVYDIITRKMIKSIQIDDISRICLFTKDQNHLICGNTKGYLYCYDINRNFKETYKKKLYQDSIIDIIQLNSDQVITCSFDKFITITNIKQKSQILQIKDAHNDWISCLEYDQKNDVIISGSRDNCIKFFIRMNGEFKFQQQGAHDDFVVKIQLLSYQINSNLLSAGLYHLNIWQIDYNKKQLNKINSLSQQHFNFTAVSNNNKIILICENVVQIFDKYLSLIQQIKHNVSLDYYYLARQLNSMNYIIVLGSKKLEVYKRQ